MRQQLDDQLDKCGAVRAKRPVYVNVYAREGDKGALEFTHDWRLQKNGPVKGKGAIEVPYGTPRSPIEFELHDETQRGLRFLKDANEAIWARVGKCPEAKGDGGQIEFPEAKTSSHTLKIDNANSADCELHYMLRFEDKDGATEKYDPIIRDKGGGP